MNRAYLKNEETGLQPWFVYIKAKNQAGIFSCRFSRKANAEKVINLLNKIFEEES